MREERRRGGERAEATPRLAAAQVGYAAGFTPNPTYEEACSGRTGHTEAVQVVYDPEKVTAAFPTTPFPAPPSPPPPSPPAPSPPRVLP